MKIKEALEQLKLNYGLSPAEHLVLVHYFLQNCEITLEKLAQVMGLDRGTVRFHFTNIYKKLNIDGYSIGNKLIYLQLAMLPFNERSTIKVHKLDLGLKYKISDSGLLYLKSLGLSLTELLNLEMFLCSDGQKDACSKLFRSTKTFKFHMSNIYKKLGIQGKNKNKNIILLNKIVPMLEIKYPPIHENQFNSNLAVGSF